VTSVPPAALRAVINAPDRIKNSLIVLGEIGILSKQTFARAFRGPFGWNAFLEQVETIGLRSMSIVVLTAVFSSMVMTIQFSAQLARFGAKEWVGNVIGLSLARELGPVLTALMVGGRVGAGIAAEIGSMNVTEQIDALRALGADPVKKLVVPRVMATMLVLPLMTAFAVVTGVLGGAVIVALEGDMKMSYFYNASLRATTMADFLSGLFKTVFFGFNIAIVACRNGMATRGGTVGVGQATTSTVVVTSVTTLISDFLLTKLTMVFGWIK